jgi:DNA repair protein RecN (Recombination protein N)
LLQNLYIQNYALIDELKVNWGEHLNIITGETGSGKSILLGALGLILGDRADINILFDKTKKCIVEACFVIDKTKYISFFEEHELDIDQLVYIRREITPQGKSRAFINDTPVNLNTLRALTSQLVDLHLQNETQELNGPNFHLNIVDTIANNNELKSVYKKIYTNIKSVEKNLIDLKELQKKAELEKDYKTFLLNELLDAKLIPNEVEQLESELEVLEHAEKITELTAQAYTILNETEENILDKLSTVKNLYTQAGKHYPFFSTLADRVASSIIELKDISQETESEQDKITQNPERLSQLNERLKQLYNLFQKHKVTSLDEILSIQQNLEFEVSQILSLDQEIETLETSFSKLSKEIDKVASDLSQSRKNVFKTVEKGINLLLPEAGLEKAQIKIEHQIKSISNDGIDQIQFLFSANTGSSFVPLHKTASGGELSRFMLCIKTYIAGKTYLPTLIFDEIDTGVSGQVAIKMGNLMQTLSNKHQLISVTHLPQIAGKANTHFKLYKEEIKGKTFSRIKELNEKEKINELAEMLGGSAYTETTLQAAAELLNK